MSEELEVVVGTGNVFRDFGRVDADIRHLKSVLAAHIIGALDDRGLTVRAAEEVSGVAAADFSRIRRVKLDRFTIDRLIGVLKKLGQQVDIDVHIEDAPKVRRQDAA